MPTHSLAIDYAGTLDAAVGAAHGLGPAEIAAEQKRLTPMLTAIEEEVARGQHGYRALPRAAGMLKQVLAAVKRCRPGCENLVVLGIGGSALGNIALHTALNPAYHNLRTARQRRGPRLFVLDNVDPTHIADLLDLLGPALRRTLFNVISKSGETAETAAQFLIVRDLLRRRLGAKQLAKRVLVTTDAEKGILRDQLARDGFDSLPVPGIVGGRFSVLSAVGLFSAAMCGANIRKLLAGADAMAGRVAQTDARKNPAALLAILLHAFYVRGKRLHVMIPYSDQLKDLADWYRQLWAESLGKATDLDGTTVHTGPTPIRALGATDQHSQVQLYREGPNDKVFVFLEVEKFARDVKIPRADRRTPPELRYLAGSSLGRLLNAEKRATEYALVNSGRPCLTIRFPAVNEGTVGQFLMLWEATTTIAGRLLNINPYDQPAVQLGKDMTFALMRRKGYEDHARRFAEFERRRPSATL
ncbi:MAG: glucose-6-phosphate isomerase [Phycisphaerae bacterium]